MNYWRYLCNAGTRPEILRRQLVGSTEERSVMPGDTIILYDYSEKEVYGPMRAITKCEKGLASNAWRGRYPYQVRVVWEDLYRITSSRFPRIENNETLSRYEFRNLVNLLQSDGDRLILPEWGSQAAAFVGDAVAEPDETRITAAREELEAQLDTEPPQTTPVEYATVDRIARDAAFRRAVRDAYDERCAVCGVRRETPDGHPEVEAAHLHPKAEGGPDDIRNGIALCKLHHWAFDNGWFTITPDLEIVVTDASARDGYSDFKPFDRQQLRLPDDSRMHPVSQYLE